MRREDDVFVYLVAVARRVNAAPLNLPATEVGAVVLRLVELLVDVAGNRKLRPFQHLEYLVGVLVIVQPRPHGNGAVLKPVEEVGPPDLLGVLPRKPVHAHDAHELTRLIRSEQLAIAYDARVDVFGVFPRGVGLEDIVDIAHALGGAVQAPRPRDVQMRFGIGRKRNRVRVLAAKLLQLVDEFLGSVRVRPDAGFRYPGRSIIPAADIVDEVLVAARPEQNLAATVRKLRRMRVLGEVIIGTRLFVQERLACGGIDQQRLLFQNGPGAFVNRPMVVFLLCFRREVDKDRLRGMLLEEVRRPFQDLVEAQVIAIGVLRLVRAAARLPMADPQVFSVIAPRIAVEHAFADELIDFLAVVQANIQMARAVIQLLVYVFDLRLGQIRRPAVRNRRRRARPVGRYGHVDRKDHCGVCKEYPEPDCCGSSSSEGGSHKTCDSSYHTKALSYGRAYRQAHLCSGVVLLVDVVHAGVVRTRRVDLVKVALAGNAGHPVLTAQRFHIGVDLILAADERIRVLRFAVDYTAQHGFPAFGVNGVPFRRDEVRGRVRILHIDIVVHRERAPMVLQGDADLGPFRKRSHHGEHALILILFGKVDIGAAFRSVVAGYLGGAHDVELRLGAHRNAAALFGCVVFGDRTALKVERGVLDQIDAAAGTVCRVGFHRAAGEVQRALHVDAAALVVSAVAGDGAALQVEDRLVVHEDAAAMLRPAAHDGACLFSTAVHDREDRLVIQFQDMAIVILVLAVAVQGVAGKVDRDLLVFDRDAIVGGSGRVILVERDGGTARSFFDPLLQGRPVGADLDLAVLVDLQVVPDGDGEVLARILRLPRIRLVFRTVALREDTGALFEVHVNLGGKRLRSRFAPSCFQSPGHGQLAPGAQVEVVAEIRRLVALDDYVALNAGIIGVVIEVEATTEIFRPIAGDGSTDDGELLIGIDAAAAFLGLVILDGAARERHRAVVVESAALFYGSVLRNRALRERCRTEVLDGTALFRVRPVVFHFHARGVERRVLGDLDAAAVVCRAVPRKRAAGHVYLAVVKVDARAVVGGVVAFDLRVRYRQRLALCIQAKGTAVIGCRVARYRAVLDGSSAFEVQATAVVPGYVGDDDDAFKA